MFGKKKDTPKVAEAVSAAVNYETTIADLAIRSARRAWFVAFSAIIMSLILAGGYFYMLPLKEKVPFLVMADAYTGTATVARLDENFQNKSITSSEAINRSNVAHYVTMRESYDYPLINLKDWRAVHAMSAGKVAVAYNELYAEKNPASPYVLYGSTKALRVTILSITMIGGGPGVTPSGATVRFQRSVYDKGKDESKPLDSKIATMQFTYNNALELQERDRIENPLGFQVTEYRVDNDFASAPSIIPAAQNLAAGAPSLPGPAGSGQQMPTDGSMTQMGAPTPPAAPSNVVAPSMPGEQQAPATAPPTVQPSSAQQPSARYPNNSNGGTR